jgi:hypothetical protein
LNLRPPDPQPEGPTRRCVRSVPAVPAVPAGRLRGRIGSCSRYQSGTTGDESDAELTPRRRCAVGVTGCSRRVPTASPTAGSARCRRRSESSTSDSATIAATCTSPISLPDLGATPATPSSLLFGVAGRPAPLLIAFRKLQTHASSAFAIPCLAPFINPRNDKVNRLRATADIKSIPGIPILRTVVGYDLPKHLSHCRSGSLTRQPHSQAKALVSGARRLDVDGGPIDSRRVRHLPALYAGCRRGANFSSSESTR